MKRKKAKELRMIYEEMKNGYGCVSPGTGVTWGNGYYVHGLGLVLPKKKSKK